MSQTIFYDRVYKAKSWIVIETNKYAPQIVEAFTQMGAFDQKWPTDSVAITLKDLANKGWYHTINPPSYPHWVTEEFVEALFRKHMSSLVGDNVYSMPQESYSHALNRKVEKPEDFVRLFEDALAMEDPLTLSRMFDLANPKSKLYITRGGNAEVISKISDFVLTVGDKNSMISVGKKPVEKVLEEIEAALPKTLKEV